MFWSCLLQEFIAVCYNVLVYIAREKTLNALMNDDDEQLNL